MASQPSRHVDDLHLIGETVDVPDGRTRPGVDHQLELDSLLL